MLRRFIAKPSVHFFLLGLALFSFNRWYNTAPDIRTVDYPDAATVSELRKQWLNSTGRPASDADVERMVGYEVDQGILLQEALRFNLHHYDTVVRQRLLRDMRFMGDSEDLSEAQLLEQAYAMDLHVNDTVVKRRLMQAMESIFRSPGEATKPGREQLDAIYQEKIEEFTLPQTRKISHVFVSSDRHGPASEQRARDLYENFSRDNVDLENARNSTDPFLSGLDFSRLSKKQLARHFGETFSSSVFECPAQPGWCGPIESPYGWHLVWLHSTEAATPQTFEAVEKKLLYYFKRAQGDVALAEKMEELRAIYQVQGKPIDGAVIEPEVSQ